MYLKPKSTLDMAISTFVNIFKAKIYKIHKPWKSLLVVKKNSKC